ncbi:hypothetical protein DFH94DRAFT_689306 [Russula ochroleuca]|uniref:Cytochrome c oxidase subunit 8, mitochondrial n=1 Tax=Russula ochroleuca TaxID=152965 RepID=A0A9P5N3B2_9AGAM|nr:hypothetical protein DFH94DRAFT_689306 [Russula ochroleuca]
MSLVARTSALRRQIVHSRAFVPSRGVHGYKHIPFNYEGSKAAFGAKVAVFLLAGFSVPFVASYYQLRKAAGGA